MNGAQSQGLFSLNRLRMERIWLLAKSEYLQRYYGSALGVFWALITPITKILIYYLVFAFLIFRDRQPDFILYLFLGITIWHYFSENTSRGIVLLKHKKYLIQNVGMAKPDIFIASSLSTSITFFLNLLIYLLFSLFFGVEYSISSLIVFPLFLNLFLLVVGLNMLLSTLFLHFRDLKQVWDLVLLVGFWSVPIIWDTKYVYETYPVMLMNPVAGLLINTRNALLYNTLPDWPVFLFDFAFSIALVLIGTLVLARFSDKAVETM